MAGMNSRIAMRNVLMALVASLALAACGGSSSDSETQQQVPTATTGTVGLLFTDKPTDDYSSIILTVSEAVLIGGDDSQQILFQGERRIDLLDLTNYNEPVMFGEVEAGNYTKIRLMIDAIELVPADDSPAFFIEKLPANGKVDLLQPDGFDILPGRTVMIEIDVDANKSIKITDAGKSGKVNFRPIVRVNIYDSGLPDKLARLEGAVSGEPNVTDGTFVLCSIYAPDYCVDIATDDTVTSYFDSEGLDTDFGALADGAMVVAFGQYSTDPSIVLNAVLVEIGGNEEQITGDVVTEPASSQFLVLTMDSMDITVELQPGTKYYDENGPIEADAVVLGARVEVEGVKPADADPELIRAAIVFLEAREDDLLSGTIMDSIEVGPPQTFMLATESTTMNVCVPDDATILFVDAAAATVTQGTFAELAVDDVVDLFGVMPEVGDGSCFVANEVIVEVPEATEAT